MRALVSVLDPLHDPGLATTHWTTDNVGEALPGVATPLTWSLWGPAMDRMCRDLSFGLGVFDAQERATGTPGGDPIVRVFHGRIAVSLEWLRLVGDRMPGTSGHEAIEVLVGRVPATMTFAPTRRRWPVIARKLPIAAVRAPRDIRALAPVTEAWWRERTAALPTAAEAQARAALADARTRFLTILTAHGFGLFAAVTPLTQAVQALVERAGVGDVGALSGTGGAEMAMVADLWRASRGQLTVTDVAARHGYHGPLEGELSSRVWREDPTPLERLVEVYAARDDAEDPIARDAAARARLPQLQAEVLAALPAWQRPAAGTLLRHAARTIVLRGVGKASFLQALDVARASARRLGELLAADGRLEHADDVFLLTLDELRRPTPTVEALPITTRGDPSTVASRGVRELVERRRVWRAEHLAVRVPASWRGIPEAVAVEADCGPPSDAVLQGIGASAGTVEGPVRVVRDPTFADVEPGEVLVSHTTDPSWAPIMFVSAALVVDIGGLISHAAVVARELGIPCVVNVRTATSALRDGDRVRVDGSAGTVEVLERAATTD